MRINKILTVGGKNMKKTKWIRAAAAVTAMVMLLGLLGACGGAAKDVPVSDISAAVDTALGKGGDLSTADANYIKGYLKMDVSALPDYVVKINAYGKNIDEYGIFKGKDSQQAKDIKASVQAYLQLRLDSWMDEYMPEEKPKLTSAEVKTSGNYVMYCILSDSDKEAAFGAFENSLK